MNFAPDRRDNNSDGGQVAAATLNVDVVNKFKVRFSLSQIQRLLEAKDRYKTLTWDVQIRNKTPINTAKVDILCIDRPEGQTFPLSWQTK